MKGDCVKVHLLQRGQESTFRGLGENRMAESPSPRTGIRLFGPQPAVQVLRPLNSGAHIMFFSFDSANYILQGLQNPQSRESISTIRKKSHLPSPPLSFLYGFCSSGECLTRNSFTGLKLQHLYLGWQLKPRLVL